MQITETEISFDLASSWVGFVVDLRSKYNRQFSNIGMTNIEDISAARQRRARLACERCHGKKVGKYGATLVVKLLPTGNDFHHQEQHH